MVIQLSYYYPYLPNAPSISLINFIKFIMTTLIFSHNHHRT